MNVLGPCLKQMNQSDNKVSNLALIEQEFLSNPTRNIRIFRPLFAILSQVLSVIGCKPKSREMVLYLETL